MTIDLSEYEYLWTTNRDEYVIVRGTDDRKPMSLIFNTSTWSALVIEDDSEAAAVVDKMIAAGVPEVRELPKRVR